MIIQEPVQAAIWHCLNHYDYSDAIFLSERLYAEVKSDETLFLLATAYFRNSQIDHAYNILKDKHGYNPQCKYLFAKCAYELQKYFDAETVLLEHISCPTNNYDDLIMEYGDQAAFVFLLLAKIAIKTERKQKAVEALKRALKINPFLWSGFEGLCKIGEKPDPNVVFQLGELDNLSKCHGNNLNNIESMIIANTPNQESVQYIMTPPQILTSPNPSTNNLINKMLFTPEESNAPNNIMLSGISVLPNSRFKTFKNKMLDDHNSSIVSLF
nr:cell division cycle protein 27 homolog [Onthophagus taurus]